MTNREELVRLDGRSPSELRRVSIQTDFLKQVAGHALIRCGSTMVLCTASVEHSVPPWLRGAGRGWVTAEYSMLPGSSATRTGRERSKVGGRTMEIQRLIGRSLRAACDLERLGERTITLDCDVLQADGGTRTASITGAYVALCRAVEGLMAAGELAQSPITGQVAAISVGIVDGVVLLDLPYVEDSAADVDMNIVMNGEGRLVEVQGTAEGVTFSIEELTRLVQVGEGGIRSLFALQDQALADCGHLRPRVGREGN